MAAKMAETTTKVLIAIDSSDISARALRWYLEKFYNPAHKLSVIHIPEYWGDVQRMMSPARIQELVEETNAKTQQIQIKVDAFFKEKGIDGTFEAVKGNEPWHDICKYADKIKANLIVIGSRGMGVVKRTILGSVSDGVLHHCDIPILIYKEQH